MGCAGSKLLLTCGGEPILERTLRSLLEAGIVSRIVLTAREEDFAPFAEVTGRVGSVDVIRGGAVRRESVLAALRYIKGLFPDSSELIVIVHDGARCFAEPSLFTKTVEAARENGAASAGVPVYDTLKVADSKGVIVRGLSRDGVWAIQTPQAFRFDLLLDAHERFAAAAAADEPTDDTSLVEDIVRVRLIESSPLNLKVTTPADLDLACRLLAEF